MSVVPVSKLAAAEDLSTGGWTLLGRIGHLDRHNAGFSGIEGKMAREGELDRHRVGDVAVRFLLFVGGRQYELVEQMMSESTLEAGR